MTPESADLFPRISALEQSRVLHWILEGVPQVDAGLEIIVLKTVVLLSRVEPVLKRHVIIDRAQGAGLAGPHPQFDIVGYTAVIPT